jgi:hypothetical protein
MNSIALHIATLLFFLITLAGCSKPYQTPLINPPNQSFKGIERLLSEFGAASIISIHGMCHHGTGWIKENRDRFGEILGMTEEDLRIIYNGGATGVKVYQTDLKGAGGKLIRLYGMLYSDVTLPGKQQELCRDVSHANDVCPDSLVNYDRKRASINDALKNKLMNDCLADAAGYLGPTGDRIRAGVRDGLFAIMKDIRSHSGLSRSPLIFLAESLGSKVLGDSLLCAPTDSVSGIMPELSRTSHVILGANQIPLLNLGFKESPCDIQVLYEKIRSTGAPLSQLREGKGGLVGLLDLIEAAKFEVARSEGRVPRTLREAGTDSFAVVAFTDPNDLLGYEITSKDVGGQPVINIIVSNASTWFGVIANPLEAHEGLRRNQVVYALLRCGLNPNGSYACPTSP